MDKTIYFKLNGGDPKNFLHTPKGWLAVGDCVIDTDQTRLLSSTCVTVGEIEAQAEYLKNLIDAAVKKAKRKLPA